MWTKDKEWTEIQAKKDKKKNDYNLNYEEIYYGRWKVKYLIDMINDMDVKDKLRLAICMSKSKWSGFIYYWWLEIWE